MRKLSKKKIISFVCAVALMAGIAGTWAYYNQSTSIDNVLQTQAYGDTTTEKFTPEKDWQPGEEVNKDVTVTNTGDYPLLVRVKMEEMWTLLNGTIGHKLGEAKFASVADGLAKQGNPAATTGAGLTDGLVEGDESVVAKAMNDGDIIAAAPSGTTPGALKWVQIGGYYYLSEPLTSGAQTPKLLDAVALAKNADMGFYAEQKFYTRMAGDVAPAITEEGTTDADADTKWVPYTGDIPENATFNRAVSVLDEAKPGYGKAAYALTITTETLQATQAAVAETWPSGSMSASDEAAFKALVAHWNLLG